MNELESTLIGESYAAAPAHILQAIGDDLAHRRLPGVPHTIYEELWHITFWQQISLEWVSGIETPFPARPSCGFPTAEDAARENWTQLLQRFLDGAQKAALLTHDPERLLQVVRCPSRPGSPVRIMPVREQLESLAAHNAYHLGRIVLLRQLSGCWPPPSGGYSW